VTLHIFHTRFGVTGAANCAHCPATTFSRPLIGLLATMARLVDERTQQLQAPSTALVTKHAEDPKQDLANERRRASFSSQELCYFLNGGKEKVERRCVPELAWRLIQLPPAVVCGC
jgi:hypothetical protein